MEADKSFEKHPFKKRADPKMEDSKHTPSPCSPGPQEFEKKLYPKDTDPIPSNSDILELLGIQFNISKGEIRLNGDCKLNKADRGTYGSAQKYLTQNNKIYIVKEIETDENILYIHEILFLKSLCGSSKFMPRLIDITINDKIASLYMSYCGRDLNYYIQQNTISKKDKLRILPSMLIQMANMLCWMKSHGVVHMDIKPQNICFDIKTCKLFLIDLGFVTPKNKYTKYCGTHQFSMPNALLGDKPPDYSTDLYACGISLLAFISRRYLNSHKYITRSENDFIVDYSYIAYMHEFRAQYNSTFYLIYTTLGDNYANILKRMLYYKENDIELTAELGLIPKIPSALEILTQFVLQPVCQPGCQPVCQSILQNTPITALELYNICPDDPFLNNLRAKYKLESNIVNMPTQSILGKRAIYEPSINRLKNRAIIYIAGICSREQVLYLFYFSIQIFNKIIDHLVDIKMIDENTYINLYGMSSILIANCIFYAIEQNKLCNLQYVNKIYGYPPNSLVINIIFICNQLQWNLYPKIESPYCNIELDIDWLKIFYISDKTYTEENYDIMISNIDSNIEKYIINATVKNTLNSIINKII